VEGPRFGRGIAALGAPRLLEMIRRIPAPATDGVRLVVALAKARSSLGHLSSVDFSKN